MEYYLSYTHTSDAKKLSVPIDEIYRCLGCKGADDNVSELIEKLFPAILDAASPRGSFCLLPVVPFEGGVELGNCKIYSSSLFENLSDSSSALVFALSLGTAVDALLAKYSSVKPLYAYVCSAISAALIESYADSFCDEMSSLFLNEALYVRPRFSPGYGDFDLEYQRILLSLCRAEKLAAICLTDECIMIPSKSISAVMGLGSTDTNCTHRDCARCQMTNCVYRRI